MLAIMSINSPASISSPTQKAFQTECVEQFAALAQVLGLPRSLGQIYGLLFASARPLSFTDIVEQLGVSKGSVSQGLNALREVGAIVPVAAQDRRREHFAPETELRNLIAGFLHGSIQPQLRAGVKRLERFKARHGAALAKEGEAGRLVLGRLGKLQKWYRRAGAVLPVISKFLG
jgi:HTH-type transcriptional regulator, glycine betaine synthesis regulator